MIISKRVRLELIYDPRFFNERVGFFLLLKTEKTPFDIKVKHQRDLLRIKSRARNEIPAQIEARLIRRFQIIRDSLRRVSIGRSLVLTHHHI